MKSALSETCAAILAGKRLCDSVLRARILDIEGFVLANTGSLNLTKTEVLFRHSTLTSSVIQNDMEESLEEKT